MLYRCVQMPTAFKQGCSSCWAGHWQMLDHLCAYACMHACNSLKMHWIMLWTLHTKHCWMCIWDLPCNKRAAKPCFAAPSLTPLLTDILTPYSLTQAGSRGQACLLKCPCKANWPSCLHRSHVWLLSSPLSWCFWSTWGAHSSVDTILCASGLLCAWSFVEICC